MSKKELVVGTSLVERPIAMLVQTAGRYASESIYRWIIKI